MKKIKYFPPKTDPPLAEIDKYPWMLAEDIPEIDFQFGQIWLSSFVNDLEKTVGLNYKKILAVYHNCYKMEFYYGQKDSDDFARHVLKKIIDNPDFGKTINIKIRKFSDKLKFFSQKINQKTLAKLSAAQLADFYQELDNLHTTLYTWGWLPNAVDMFHNNFTDYLKSILAKKISEEKINQLLVVLSVNSEKSVFNNEHESFLKLAALKQGGQSKEKLISAIEDHLKKYFYLKHLWLGKEGVYTTKYYLNEINKFVVSGEKAAELLKKENKILRQYLNEKNELIKKLKLNKSEIKLFDVYSEFAVTKAYRRDAQIFWAYKMDLIFSELSRRLKLSVDEVRCMFPVEVTASLVSGVDKKLISDLKKRTKYFVYYAEKGKDKIIYGDEAKEIENKIIQQPVKEIKEILGQTACLGKAKGRVKIINIISDLKKMEKGDVLVSIATNPDIVPAMKIAAAIVTEQGGITSHAAIVSRELGIPCVIGTKIATKVLKDGDLVEVDANKGLVKLIKNKS